jgi:hypothetical protein
MKTKVQDPLSTVKAEGTHQILAPYTSKSIALIQTDVGHQKIGRKKTELIRPKEITTQEAVIQIEAEAGGDTKTDLYTACFMRDTQTMVRETIPFS